MNLFDGAVDPGTIDPPAVAIDGQPSLAVIQSANHQISPAKNARAKIVNNITVEESDIDRRINLLCRAGCNLGLEGAGVAFAIEN